jgi:putative cell wall-binding protein
MPATTDVYGDFNIEIAGFDAAKIGTWKVTAAPAAGCPATADFSNLVVKAQRTVDRIFGIDRYETAAKLSAANFPAGTANVFIATGALYPDALAGGPAAAVTDGPILLVQPNAIPTATRNELMRLKPTTVYLLGGPGAVSNAVQTQLAGLTTAGTAASVVRLGGADRYETAALISKRVFAANAPAVLIATGQNYPDALAGSAAGARHGIPILLVRTDSIPAATSAELLRLHPQKIYVLGGTGVVSSALQTQLAQYTVAKNAADVVRLAGPTRYETAAAITDAFFPAGLSPVYIATGLNFPDALAAGPLGRAVLLVPGTSVPVAVGNEVRRLAPVDVHALGGPTVVSDGVLTIIASLLQ